jgi:hypothetical protein
VTATINAHQLGQLIDKTIDHAADDHIEQLHGIRIDVDTRYLYAVASDRYTMAVARYLLDSDDQDGQPWARTIPGNQLKALREWVSTMKGAEPVTISTSEDRLLFEGRHSTFSVMVNTTLEFPNWRGILRNLTKQTTDGEPFPAYNSMFLGRFASTENIVRVRVTADHQAALLYGEDFIGAIMPVRLTDIGQAKVKTYSDARDLWLWTLAAGSKDADMASLPKPDHSSSFEAPKDVHTELAALLEEVLRSGSDLSETDYSTDRDLWDAHIRIGVANWLAYRYLDALYHVDPRVARKVVADTAEQLDSGEIGEWAWDAAEEAGHDPRKWDEDYANARAEQRAKRAPEWATRLALGLNVARAAGIGFRVEDNPHVVFDETDNEWVAVQPTPAETAPAA